MTDYQFKSEISHHLCSAAAAQQLISLAARYRFGASDLLLGNNLYSEILLADKIVVTTNTYN